MTTARAGDLAARTTGPVWLRDGADADGYDRQRRGYNLALDHRPSIVLAAETPADIATGVRFAAECALALDVQATGHGAYRAMDGGLLISTRRLTAVEVDPVRRTARVSAGATSADVLTAAARHGLAATVGAAPGVGFVSYTLSGGLGPLGRTYGWSADHVRALDIVTADGRELRVTRDHHPELYWGLRGGGGNVAAVTALEIDLQPVTHLYAGGLFFDGERASDVLPLFRRCTADAPKELSLSVAVVSFPDVPAVPPPVRGRSCCHVRLAWLGGTQRTAEAERMIAALRTVPTVMDTIRVLPVTDIGSLHADPVAPRPVHSDSATLHTGDAVDQLADGLDPAAPFMLEVRHLGGALADPPQVTNAVGHRAAAYTVFTSAYPGVDATAVARAQRRVYDRLAPACTGGPLRGFLPSHCPDATACYEPETAVRLARLKTTWDPTDRFRYVPAIVGEGPPAP